MTLIDDLSSFFKSNIKSNAENTRLFALLALLPLIYLFLNRNRSTNANANANKMVNTNASDTKEFRNIVIVGASASGHGLASSLVKKLSASSPSPSNPIRIILIDSSPIAFWPPAALRAAVVPGWEKKVYRPIERKEFFKDEKNVVIRAKVVKVHEGDVEIDGEFEGGNVIPFEAIAFATGASQPFPMRPEESHDPQTIEKSFQSTQRAIQSSTSVLIIGGGPTGIEMAGEIRAQYPDKKITLVHKHEQLLDDRFPPKLARTLEEKLRKLNVDLVLGDQHIAGPEFKSGAGHTLVATKGGKRIEADYVFIAIGNTPRSGLIKAVDPSAISSANLIKVNEQLQIKSSFFPKNNAFALGDVCDAPGWRSLVNSEAEIATVAANMANIVVGKKTTQNHKPGMRALVVPLGLKDGSGFLGLPLLGDSVLPTMMVTALKAKTLFTEKFDQRFAPV